MTRIVCLCVLLSAGAHSAAAQDVTSAPAAPLVYQQAIEQVVLLQPRVEPAKRPAILMPLYASSVALQGMDFMTTHKALASGRGVEANPVMRPVAGNRGALLAVKGGTAAGTIWMSEKLWKRNRIAAIAMMAGLNGAMAAVVSHNMEAVR